MWHDFQAHAGMLAEAATAVERMADVGEAANRLSRVQIGPRRSARCASWTSTFALRSTGTSISTWLLRARARQLVEAIDAAVLDPVKRGELREVEPERRAEYRLELLAASPVRPAAGTRRCRRRRC